MAVNTDIRAKLPDDAVIFDNAAYDNSIIGVTLDGRAIYDYDLMVEEFATDNECSAEDAMEWVEFNTIRALPYAGDSAPLIVSVV